MSAFEIYAFVKNELVQNIACYSLGGYAEANTAAQKIYGEEAEAIDVTNIPVQIGDTYHDGRFFHNGIPIEPYPTDAEEIAQLKADNKANSEAIDDIIISLLEG